MLKSDLIASLKKSATPWFIVSFCLVLSILISLSRVYSGVINADTIVVYLSGILRWTPFFWWLDRYGMLISGLTFWITDPLLQTFVHNVLFCFTNLMSFFLISYCFFENKKWLDFALLSIVFYLTLGTVGETVLYLTPWQIYAPAIFCGLLGIIFIEKSFLLGLILLILSQWANFSIIVFIGVIVLVRWSVEENLSWSRKKTKLSLALILAFWGGKIIKSKFGQNITAYGFSSFEDGFVGVTKFIVEFWVSSNYHIAFIVVPPALWLLIICIRRLLKKSISKSEIPIRTYFIFLILIFVYLFCIASNTFAKTSFYPIRYLFPVQFLWVVFWSAVALNALDYRLRLKDSAKLSIVGAICAIIICFRFELPISYSNFKNMMIDRYGKLYENVEEAQCTHIAGDYYRAWPLVYYSRMVNSPNQLWALTVKSESTIELWDLTKYEHPRICIFQDNLEEGKWWLAGFSKLKFPIEERINNLVVFTK